MEQEEQLRSPEEKLPILLFVAGKKYCFIRDKNFIPKEFGELVPLWIARTQTSRTVSIARTNDAAATFDW